MHKEKNLKRLKTIKMTFEGDNSQATSAPSFLYIVPHLWEQQQKKMIEEIKTISCEEESRNDDDD